METVKTKRSIPESRSAPYYYICLTFLNQQQPEARIIFFCVYLSGNPYG